ncbi:MAG: type I-D CRISPR-associated helicase Cas3', partial [Chloroflexi bacterium]|nr:type I-D CRISPR-associated helicase Cas3' [Chloroflexota bacterium]
MTSSVTILPNEIQQVRHEFFAERGLPDWLPYAHQAIMLDLWDQHGAFLVTTGTGTGKTQAALAPVLRGGESAVFIYPTNALAHDQVTAMKTFAEKMRYRAFVFPDDEDKPGLLEADVILFQVTSGSLDTLMERYRHRVSKGTALKEHLALGKKQLILLTNFDTLYLIETGRYRDSLLIFKALERCSTLVVDEFHLYRGLELAHALFIAVWAQTNNVFHDRIVFLSATPDTTTASLLDALFDPKQ